MSTYIEKLEEARGLGFFDGDVIIAQGMAIGHEKTLKLLRGTGKWKGIKGEAKGKIAAVGKDKSLMPGSFQAYSRYIGSFDLPK